MGGLQSARLQSAGLQSAGLQWGRNDRGRVCNNRRMNTSTLPDRIQSILDVALNRHLGLVFDRHHEGVAHAHFDATAVHAAFGGIHGGALYALLDAVAMLALLPSLPPSRHAVTHDLHVSMMRPVAPGARCHLQGRVVRQGRTLAFLDATAEVDGQVIASARVTKSLTPA